MRWQHWTKRFLLAFVVAWVALLMAHLLRGHSGADAVRFAVLWGSIAAAIFTMAGYIKYRRSPACMLPRSRER